jgi:nicotinamidase/pyrazinamidase
MKTGTNMRKICSFDVDPQVGFSPLCPNELPVPDGDKIVDALNEQAKLADIRVASKDAHNPNGLWIADKEHPQFSPVGLPNIDIRWNRHCEIGQKGFDFLPGLPKPLEYDFVVYKGIEVDSHPYGACFTDMEEKRSTGIIEFLRDNDITDIIVGGLALNYCVSTTAIQLAKAGFRVFVNISATKSIGDPAEAINKMKECGITICDTVEDVKKGILL